MNKYLPPAYPPGSASHPIDNNSQAAYPVYLFPKKLGDLIDEQHRNNEAATSMIGTSIIGALSGAIQDKIDVETLSGAFVPPIVWTLSIAESGSRKSTIDKMISKFFGVFEAKMPTILKSAMAIQTAKHMNWKADMERMEKGMKSKLAEEERETLQAELVQLLQNEPQLINLPRIVYQDVTPEAIYRGLMAWPSGMVSSSESGALFSSRTFNNLPQFNRFWDGGEDHRIDRISSESIVVKGPRLTISLMVQPKTFTEFLKGKGRLARDSGFLARFLVCQPERLAGYRFGINHTGSWIYQEEFQARMLEILEKGVSSSGGPAERQVLTLSPDARGKLKQFANMVEAELAHGEYLCDVPDAASKLAENASRVAALFHHYEGEKGSISADTMRRAVDLCRWYMMEFKRLFAESPTVPLEFQDAIAVEMCLRRASDAHPGCNVMKKYLFTHGPNAVRTKARLDMALDVLCQQNKVAVEIRNKKLQVLLNPAFFPTASPNLYQGGYMSSSPLFPRSIWE